MSNAIPEAEHIATVHHPSPQLTKSSFWLSRKRKRDRDPPLRNNLPPLLDGKEPDMARELRKRTFESLWEEQQCLIDVYPQSD
jgi:hypothetical protein